MVVKHKSVRNYLIEKAISFYEKNGEIITKCLFNDCDEDSRGEEAHLYINSKTSQFDCKKCGKSGNIFTLATHFGDSKDSLIIKDHSLGSSSKEINFDNLVIECHKNLPLRIRGYLNNRGITDEVINSAKLGYSRFYSKNWITVPIKNKKGNYSFFKLREDPKTGNKKLTYPKGKKSQLYKWDTLDKKDHRLLICEGELDCLLTESKKVNAISSTHGVANFKKEWVRYFNKIKEVYICFDNDRAGKTNSIRILKLFEDNSNCKLFKITLPKEVGKGGDITDYFQKQLGSVEDLFLKYSKEYPEKIDTSKFKPLKLSQLKDILGLTIKRDNTSKIITFLGMLSAYTDDSQLNITFNSPSSTGKSYIPLEIAKYFPYEDIIEIGYSSPKSFFHDAKEYDMHRNAYILDLSKKIIIFLDQPHNILLQYLRSLLSHDKKEITNKIVDSNGQYGTKTKTIIIKGYPVFIFCTADFKIDEQEATRFILLSPEMNQDKIRDSINEAISKGSDKGKYLDKLEENEDRLELMERIKAIKNEGNLEIIIENPGIIRDRFLKNRDKLKPAYQRDIKKILALIKVMALLNLWFKKRKGNTIYSSDEDIEDALSIWQEISISQDLGIPPYVYDIYKIIYSAFIRNNKKNTKRRIGIDRKDVQIAYFDIYGKSLNPYSLRAQILPLLENSGLIYQENGDIDKRKKYIIPQLEIKEEIV